MANSSYRLRFFNVLELGLTAANATTGVWTLALSAAGVPASTVSLDKAAAGTTSVIHIPVPRAQKAEAQEDGQATVLKLFYNVTTANLTTAPSVVLNKVSQNTSTGLNTITAITQAITFAGVDAIGKVAGAAAAGSHIAVVTITTPVTLADNETLIATFTMGEAATSVLDITGMSVAYN
jgi:hypothetical protein